jgi:nicotinate-nucleotide adenylyltransferase
MNTAGHIGLLGGTLDPIHAGHVETALAAKRALGLDRVYVLPSNVPPHRAQQPFASGYHRFAMTALAIDGIDGLAASDIELRAPGPSYTADTLTRFRERSGIPGTRIFFITGADAFAEIETWHRYPEVLELAHFAVVSRPQFPVEGLRDVLPSLAPRMVSVGANREPQIANREPRTANREPRTANRDLPGIFLIDAPTPDVSSTEIRRRLFAGEPVSAMLPDAVERHIRRHRLYSSSPDSLSADHLHGQS